MARLHCSKCGALAHKVIDKTPYCNSCVPKEEKVIEEPEVKKSIKPFIVECGCSNKQDSNYCANDSNDDSDDTNTEKNSKSFWGRMFSN